MGAEQNSHVAFLTLMHLCKMCRCANTPSPECQGELDRSQLSFWRLEEVLTFSLLEKDLPSPLVPEHCSARRGKGWLALGWRLLRKG